MADEVLTYAIKMDTAQAIPALKDMGETAKEADADVLRLASDLGKLSEAEVRTAAAIRDAKTSLDNQASALGLSRGEFQRMQLELNKLLDAENAATRATQANAAANQARSEALSSASGALSLSRTQLEAIGEQAGKTAQSFKSSAGAIQAAGSNLRSQFLDVGVSLQGGLNPLTVFSQQGPQIAEALASVENKGAALSAAFAPLGTALKVVLSMLGPLSIAAAAAGAAFAVYSNETERAEEKSQRFVNALDGIQDAANKAADALDAAQSSWESFQGKSTSLMSKLEVLTGVKTQAQADIEQEVAEIEAQTQPRIDALNQEVNALSAEIQVRRQEINAAREDQKNMSFSEIRASTDRIKVLENEIAMAETRRQQRKEQISAAEMEVEQVKLLAEIVVDMEGAEKRRTEYTKIATKEAKAQTKELEKQAAEVERIMAAQVSRENTRTREAFSSAGAAASTAAGLDMTQLRGAELELGYTLAELQQALAETTDAAEAEAIRDFIQALITSASEVRSFGVTVEQASRSQRAAEGITTAVGVAAGGSSSITSLLGSAGPYGALAATAIDLAKGAEELSRAANDAYEAALAEGKSIEEAAAAAQSILDSGPLMDIAKLPEQVANGLDVLVPMLTDAIGVLITESQPIFVQALPDLFVDVVTIAIPGIAKAMVQSIWILLTESIPSIINSVRENLGTVFGMAVRELRDLNLRESIGEALAKAFTVDFWREVIQGLIEAIRGFSFADIETPGIDAFRSAAGLQDRERQTLGQRIDAARDGGGVRSVVYNISGAIGDPRSLRRYLRDIGNRRDGVGSIG